MGYTPNVVLDRCLGFDDEEIDVAQNDSRHVMVSVFLVLGLDIGVRRLHAEGQSDLTARFHQDPQALVKLLPDFRVRVRDLKDDARDRKLFLRPRSRLKAVG